MPVVLVKVRVEWQVECQEASLVQLVLLVDHCSPKMTLESPDLVCSISIEYVRFENSFKNLSKLAAVLCSYFFITCVNGG